MGFTAWRVVFPGEEARANSLPGGPLRCITLAQVDLQGIP